MDDYIEACEDMIEELKHERDTYRREWHKTHESLKKYLDEYRKSINYQTEVFKAIGMLANQRHSQFNSLEEAKFFVDRFLDIVCVIPDPN